MIRLLIPRQISAVERRHALARAMCDWHSSQLIRRREAHLGRLIKYHQARRDERAALDRVRAWRAVQIVDGVA